MLEDKKVKIKYKQVKVNLADEIHQQLDAFCNKLGITKAQYIRQILGATFEKNRQPKSKKTVNATDPKLLYQLNKIGNNLNQISKKVNINRELDIEAIIKLNSIEKNMMKLL